MTQIYEQNLWGNSTSKFYSGEGSHQPELVQPYIEAVSAQMSKIKEPLTICDLGCGDFNVGKQLVSYARSYIAVDIVAELIAYNAATFKAPQLEFRCLDIAKDTLPAANCAIVRQILQHLSNTEIHQILEKLHTYTYLFVTEHVPSRKYTPNLDIISGQGTRLKKHSGVCLTAPPFNFKSKATKELLSLPLPNNKGSIITTFYHLV